MAIIPEFAIDNGIRRQIRTHLRQKKVLTYSRVCSHFFLPNLHPSLSSRCFVSIAKSGIMTQSQCGQIEKMMAADIAVSDERLRVLMIVCCRSSSSVRENLDKMRDYIAFKIRIDEKACRSTDTAAPKQ